MKPSMNNNHAQNLYAKTEWARYYAEYAQAVEVMLEKPDATQQPLLALPLLHSIHHTLRMAFKTHLLLLKNLPGEEPVIGLPVATGGTLPELYQEFDSSLQRILYSNPIKVAIRETCVQNNQCLASFYPIFGWMDSNAHGFLYPVQQDGLTKSFQKTDNIDFSDLVPVYNITLAALKDTTALLLNRSNWSSSIVRKPSFQKIRPAV